MIFLIDGASHLSLINDEVMKVNKSNYASRRVEIKPKEIRDGFMNYIKNKKN